MLTAYCVEEVLPAEYAPRSNKDCEKSHQEANSAAASVADAPERLSPTDLAFEKRCHKPRGGGRAARRVEPRHRPSQRLRRWPFPSSSHCLRLTAKGKEIQDKGLRTSDDRFKPQTLPQTAPIRRLSSHANLMNGYLESSKGVPKSRSSF